MRVLHISTTDITGGAGIAAKRLHDALRMQGVESFMLVQSKKSKDKFVLKNYHIPFINKIRSELDYLPLRKRIINKHNFSPAWFPGSIHRKIKKINPDIIHLHWINGGFIKIEPLSKIKVPILWSLHDMWPFTGGCHYDNGCNKFTDECKNCPELKNSDAAFKILKKKQSSFEFIKKLHINGLSKWIGDSAQSSRLFKDREVHNLPNCIDIEVFYPINKKEAKKALGITLHSKMVLFGGIAATQDERKGFDLLQEALFKQSDNQNLTLAVFGNAGKKESFLKNIRIKYLGHINNIEQLRLIYSAADAVVVPSRQENLSNVVLESLACGTPVVAFNIGGMPDMINHQFNGYLAQPFNELDLAKGINWTITNQITKKLNEKARNTIKGKYDYINVAKKYIELYQSVITG